MRIIVDADACPKGVLTACVDIGERYGVDIYTVANFNHNVTSPHHIVVGDVSQEADIKIANLTRMGDVVITQDWGLAALVLGKGALCLSPLGREYKEATIEFLLEEREAKAKYRRSGNRTKGPKKRQLQDDNNFRQELEQIITTVRSK
jgi:hypothetical protein